MRSEVYEGKVLDRNDPEGLGRVKIALPAVWGDTISDWIRPLVTLDNRGERGIFMVPSLEANVCVVFIQGGGDPILSSKFARYVAECWRRPFANSGIPSETQQGNPDIAVIAFKGFAIVVDERAGQEKATLIDRTNGSYIRLDVATGNVLLNSKNDFERTVGRDEKSTIVQNQTDTIQGKQSVTVTGDAELTTSGKRKVTTAGDEERSVGGSWKITVVGNAEIKATGNALLDGTGGVRIGSAALFKPVLETLLIWLNGHQHSGVTVGSGISGLPLVSCPTSVVATKTKVE